MIQWKQHLYAFLLRRVLGPFLDDSATKQLHDSLEFSLQEGKFVLKDICLDANYLTEKIVGAVPGLTIRTAKVRRLEINLALKENHEKAKNSTTPTTSSSLAWRAMKLGTSTSTLPAVSLVAEIKIHGVELVLEPSEYKKKPSSSPLSSIEEEEAEEKRKEGQQQPSAKSMIGSYVDAALAALQLSLKLTDINIRLCCKKRSPANQMGKETWISLKFASLSYKDLHPATSAASASSSNVTDEYKTVFNKRLDISEITILSGEEVFGANLQTKTNRQSTVAKAQGTGHVFFQLIEFTRNENLDTSTSSRKRGDGDEKNSSNRRRLQQNIEAKLSQQLNFSVDPTSIMQIQRVADAFMNVPTENEEYRAAPPSDISETSLADSPLAPPMGSMTDQEDLKALTGIMKQYREAYHLAEQNQLKGGILVPSHAYLDGAEFQMEEEDAMTFDVFFDANDQSIYNAASVLKESMRMSRDLSVHTTEGQEQQQEEGGEDQDSIQTKLSLQLLGGSMKVVFREVHGPHMSFRPDEYALVSMDDLNVSYTSSHRFKELALTIAHFAIEDAQLSSTKKHRTAGFVSMGGGPAFEGAVDIGSLLSFVTDPNMMDEYENDVVVSEAPCITIHMKNTTTTSTESGTTTTTTKVSCDVSLLPIEISFRQRTLSNLSAFVNNLKERNDVIQQHHNRRRRHHQQQQPSRSSSSSKNTNNINRHSTEKSNESKTTSTKKEISFCCLCSSISFTLPLVKEVTTDPLFARGREILNGHPVRGTYLGIILENNAIEWNEGGKTTTMTPTTTSSSDDATTKTSDVIDSGAKFSCHYISFFASSPVGDKVVVDTVMRRTDILVGKGRLEVNPYTPISIEYKANVPGTKERNHCKESFPIIPTISSFKARQEDEDEDNKIDRMLTSKLHDVDADSRKELRGTDPQLELISEVEQCSSAIIVNIPIVVVDMTRTEIETLLLMLDAITPDDDDNKNSSSDKKYTTPTPEEPKDTTSSSSSPGICFGLNIDQISLSLKETPTIPDTPITKIGQVPKKKEEEHLFSCLVALDTFRVHAVLGGGGLKQVRVLAQELCFYVATHPLSVPNVDHPELDVHDRVALVQERIHSYKNSTVHPILYRSHLFTPISQDTPSLLIDVINFTPSSSSSSRGGARRTLEQKRIHATIYHLTYHYDVENDWIQRIGTVIPNNNKSKNDNNNDDKGTETSRSMSKETESMTKIFVSLADCNLDYTSPHYFEEASRSIVRIGDFRFSSNIMSPSGPVQGYSLSIGDLYYHVCNRRYSYTREHSSICRAGVVLSSQDIPTNKFGTRGPAKATETLLRELGFVEVLSLDSMDAVIAVANNGDVTKGVKHPKIRTNLTFGILSIHACKDSFNCFTGTVGELQAKLTALSEADIEAMRTESPTPPRPKIQQPKTAKPSTTRRKQINLRKKPSSPKSSFLLDGYDWTTIDHDPYLPELKIPEGHEQAAVWYDDTASGSAPIDPNKSRAAIFPGKIIPQHFPIQALHDPLADGDMGASHHAGENANITVKSRLLVHKLTVKTRFFDGYDWPEAVTVKQLKAAKEKDAEFVIEPIPKAAPAADDSTEGGDSNDFDEVQKQTEKSLARKSKLMSDLLDGEGKDTTDTTFKKTPLPEDRAFVMERRAEVRRLSRKTSLFFQISANGVRLRVDSLEKSDSHRLVSILTLNVSDLFLAETASLSNPIKMLGEWVNDSQHPRDTRHGTLMLKMVTWNPERRVTDDNEIESDDCEVTMQLLPMRCIIDQRAISFIRAFFNSSSDDDDDDDDETKEKWSSGLHLVPPPRFRSFRVKPWKLKVDYIPRKMDIAALREGSLVELVNVSPIDGMVITLSQVNVSNVLGGGEVMSGLLGSWVQEICATQLHKFLANARPFEPITDVGQGVTDLVILPYEAFKNGEDVSRAMTLGLKSLAGTVAYQALTTSSRLTQYAAQKMAATVLGKQQQSPHHHHQQHPQRRSQQRSVSAMMTAAGAGTSSTTGTMMMPTTTTTNHPLPARPANAPKGVSDVAPHAVESIARGFQTANYKVIVIPYREYTRNGVTGAVTSILKGVPVLVVAPLSGATEALSYTLLGARNALRPDIRREEEASRTGFNGYDP